MADGTMGQGMIGIFGGTFDPVHFGHLRAALEAREALELDELRLLPAGTPPHRPPPEAPADHRLAMLQQVADGVPAFSVDDREVRRPGYSWMADTLDEIRGEVGATPLLLLLGQDAANALHTWHEWRRLFDLAHIVVMHRPEACVAYPPELGDEVQGRSVDDPESLRRQSAGLVLSLEVTQLDISSSNIRRLLAAGRSPRFLLPDSALAYIRRHHLYGAA